MIYDPILFKVKNYIRTGSRLILNQDVKFKIERRKREHYLGLSSLTSCGRLIWAKYYCPNSIPEEILSEQTYRIFDLGHIIEDITLQIIEKGGGLISGEQLSFEDFDGKVRGHADGILDNEHILEVKSMNQKSFDLFTATHLSRSHPTYFAQVQMYMHYGNMHNAIVVATNKNTSEIECQVIYKDQDTIDFYLSKLRDITTKRFFTISKEYLPTDKNECKFCPLYKTCYPR